MPKTMTVAWPDKDEEKIRRVGFVMECFAEGDPEVFNVGLTNGKLLMVNTKTRNGSELNQFDFRED